MLTLPRPQQPSPGVEPCETNDAAVPPRRGTAAAQLSVDVTGEEGGVVLPSPAGSDRVGGVAIATCCHHLCNWRDYTGQEYLRRLVG